MYTFESRIRYSETDEQGNLTLHAMIDYMQDCTNFQTEDLGVGIQWHKEHALMWVLHSWQIIIKRYPGMGERITVGTQAYGFEKMFGYRNFLIEDEHHETAAVANSVWVLMDLKKNRPRTVTEEIAGVYGKAEPLEMEYASRKIKIEGTGWEAESFPVKEYHLDTNHHVNNGQYVRMAMEFLKQSREVCELRAEYKKQAKLGELIFPVIYEAGEKETIVSLNDTDGKAYSIVQFFFR